MAHKAEMKESRISGSRRIFCEGGVEEEYVEERLESMLVEGMRLKERCVDVKHVIGMFAMEGSLGAAELDFC
jgi:hypothetical protein